MTSLNGVSGSSSSWPAVSGSSSHGRAKLFAKIDTDGDGSIDMTELQSAFDKIAAKTGGTALNANDLFSAIDTDGDGKISSSELDAGLKNLLQPPSSTVDFASRQGGGDLFAKVDTDGSGSLDANELQAMLDKINGSSSTSSSSSTDGTSGLTGADLLKKLDTDGDGKVSKAEFEAGRPHGHGGHHGGPPPAAASSSSGSTSTSTSSDPADTNGDGTVSAQERAAADLKALLAGLASATKLSNENVSNDVTSTALSMFA